MPGRPVRRGVKPRPAGALKRWHESRDRLTATAKKLNDLKPGAGDELLKQAVLVVDRLLEERLSSFPGGKVPGR